MNKGHVKFIVSFSIIACILLYVFEQVLGFNYEMKTLSKIVIFLSVPCLYLILFVPIKNKNIKNSSWILSILLAALTFLIIWLGYFLFGQWVDFQSIQEEMKQKSGITKESFIWISLYVVLGNSFLEEFFFRGFVFKQLLQNEKKKLGYLLSAGLFAVYHVAIFQTWFTMWIMVIVLFALFTVGILFNYLTEKANSFLASWLIHISADIAIISIAFKVFVW